MAGLIQNLTLVALRYPDCTLGRLSFGDEECFTLELPWKDNEKNISCIPSGVYHWFKRESPSNGPVIQLENVPNRTYIQIHPGNFTSQIAGCILVGDNIRYVNNDLIPDVANSERTHCKLLDLTADNGVIEVIHQGITEHDFRG